MSEALVKRARVGDFFCTERTVKAVRKPRQCPHCLRSISVGDPALVQSGVWDSGFQSHYMHPECNAAAQDYDNEFLTCVDERPWLHQLEREDLEELRTNHPIAVDRLDRK